jgi:hypothetical protein
MNSAAAWDTSALHAAITGVVAGGGSVRAFDPDERFMSVPFPGALRRALRRGGRVDRRAPWPEHTR